MNMEALPIEKNSTNESYSTKTPGVGVVPHPITSTFSMEINPLYESHNVSCPIKVHTSVEENKISRLNRMKNILANRICSKERMIKVTIAITFVLLVCIAGVMLASVLKKSSGDNSSLRSKTNNDYFLLVQEIERRKENGPCHVTEPDLIS